MRVSSPLRALTSALPVALEPAQPLVLTLAVLLGSLTAGCAGDARVERAYPLRIACVGDSITEGSANANHGLDSWPQILGRMLQHSAPGRFETRNFGSSGATLLRKGRKPYHAQEQYAASLAYRPDVVILNLGANDAAPGNWLEHGAEFEHDARALIESYLALGSRPRVWLSSLTPIDAPYALVAECTPARNEIEAILSRLGAEYGLAWIDFTTPLSARPKLFPDGLHPNTTGNELMAAAAHRTLTGQLGGFDPSLAPGPVEGPAHALVRDGRAADVQLGAWTQADDWVEGTGAGRLLRAGVGLGPGDFQLRARLRMLGQRDSAACFRLDDAVFGFEGAQGRAFRRLPQAGGLRLLHPAERLWERDAWIDFEVIRNGERVWFLVDGFCVDVFLLPGPIEHLEFDPTRSRMQITDWSLVGDVRPDALAPEVAETRFSLAELDALLPAPGYDIPLIDLDGEVGRHVVVDREAGQYLGHVTTALLEDGRTLLAVYPKGHGQGGIVLKRSDDGGLTWSERLPTPESWASSREVPTIHRVIDPDTGARRLILWSGLYPARLAVSEDDGASWSELQPVGDWGGIVVMGFVERLQDGRYLAMFHDDGRFFREDGVRTDPPTFTLYQTFSADGGLTWSEPAALWSGRDIQLCEPGAIRSPDGDTLAVLLRENSRTRNSHVIVSRDEGRSWSAPRELPGSLTGDRHTGKYAPDGRLFISFRDTTRQSATQGDWVGWVGRFEDLLNGTPGQYRVRLKDNTHAWDCAYPGVEVLPDGTFVVTTYGHWDAGRPPYILSARFTLDELDQRARELAPQGLSSASR